MVLSPSNALFLEPITECPNVLETLRLYVARSFSKADIQSDHANQLLYRQLGIPPSDPGPVDGGPDVRPDNRNVACEGGDGAEEVAKQNHDAVELDAEADQGPPQQDQGEPREEGRRALCLLFPREEEERLLGSDDDCEANEE